MLKVRHSKIGCVHFDDVVADVKSVQIVAISVKIHLPYFLFGRVFGVSRFVFLQNHIANIKILLEQPNVANIVIPRLGEHATAVFRFYVKADFFFLSGLTIIPVGQGLCSCRLLLLGCYKAAGAEPPPYIVSHHTKLGVSCNLQVLLFWVGCVIYFLRGYI